ncbi:MAG: 7-cyano-7-deazaguanine synthase [Candidatus Hodarchaeales archaeon]|jgi:7-cyano-7-deazaguanine synthase in queuosine biosynthesis
MSDEIDKEMKRFSDKKIVLLISGGLDSMGALIALCHYGAKEIQPLFINRGQINYQNEEKAICDVFESKIFKKYSVEIHPYSKINTSIPAKELKERFPKSNIPINDLYFARNSDLLNNAARLAHCLNAEERNKGGTEFYTIIASGSIKSNSVPDENKVFFEIKEKEFTFLANKVTDNKQEPLQVCPPFIVLGKNKEDAYTHVIKLNEDWEEVSKLTWSCWNCGEKPCEECRACKERKIALDRYRSIEQITRGSKF